MNKVLLIILDGFGIAPDSEGNAITQAHPKTLNWLNEEVPHTNVKADSHSVGLPKNTLGGSEVGHFTIGAGRVVFQSLELINQQIESEEFFKKPEFLKAAEVTKQNDSTLHLIGMISDEGIHSHIDHLFALMKFAKRQNIKKVAIHAIADGRDVPERSVKKFLKQIQQKIDELGIGEITDLIGRFYAMDRDNNWARTEMAYKLFALSEGKQIQINEVENEYNDIEHTDYYLKAKKFTDNPIRSCDAVIFFNYRTDRSKQLTDAFTLKEFDHFKREPNLLPYFVCFGEYTKVAPVAFPPPNVKDNLAKLISDNKIPQLRITETEKFPHVTFFFNSQNKQPYPLEERILIPSPKVPSYAEKPEMSAYETTEELIKQLNTQKFGLAIINYANLDLVGHSGDIDATIKAVKVVDECLEQVLQSAKENGYSVIITGDHGNADQMYYPSSHEICPAHSMNPTRCYVITDKYENYSLRQDGIELKDIAPTIADLMDLTPPNTWTGSSLIVKQ